jgi:hypothetical protein
MSLKRFLNISPKGWGRRRRATSAWNKAGMQAAHFELSLNWVRQVRLSVCYWMKNSSRGFFFCFVLAKRILHLVLFTEVWTKQLHVLEKHMCLIRFAGSVWWWAMEWIHCSSLWQMAVIFEQ